jgi:NADH:ubiquinone reductase (H+-translocating)
MQHIAIVGGGAGGLALATQLGQRLGRKKLVRITLVDSERTHVWKPLLHQLAGLDRDARVIRLAASHDVRGAGITPAAELHYDRLVIAVGSQTHDFGTPGAAEHSIKLDSPAAARHFNDRLINACIRAQSVPGDSPDARLSVVIVGGGATGVDLAAELHACSFGTASGMRIASTLTVWAAGIKAADFLAGIGGAHPLETNRLNQLVVDGHLRCTRDERIFAFGDCAACAQPGGDTVPPHAQAAHQQAMYLLRELSAVVRGKPPPARPFVFEDQGSLVSRSDYSSVGSLMRSLTRGSLFVEGQPAKLMYWGLHKQHQWALGGLRKTGLITLSEVIDRAHRPRIKMH